jgi:hypothetical protein
LFNAVHEQFSHARNIGYKFHFKQAIRRKLLELKFSKTFISVAMRPVMVDSIRESPEKMIKVTPKEIVAVLRQ